MLPMLGGLRIRATADGNLDVFVDPLPSFECPSLVSVPVGARAVPLAVPGTRPPRTVTLSSAERPAAAPVPSASLIAPSP